MSERSIVKSERYNIGKLFLVFVVIAAILLAGTLVVDLIEYREDLEYYEENKNHTWPGDYYISAESYAQSFFGDTLLWGGIIPGGALILIGALIYAEYSKIEITVTDKRVYGKTVFGKRVDLPMDSVSAVAARWPKGIAVATSSGKIAFLMIKNRDEIHRAISELLVERQTNQPATPTITQEVSQSNADELKKFKELFDAGIITEEEFNTKKKQLLGL